MNQLPPSIARVANRYKTNSASVDRGRSHEAHDLRSLSARLLLSSTETLEQVAAGNLITLESRNGKHVFSARSLDSMRARVVEFIAGEIMEEMSARGASEERIIFAMERAFQRQFDLARGRGENVVSFAQTPADDDDDFYSTAKKTAGTAAGIGAAGLAGYGAYKGYQYLRNRANGDDGNALPGSGTQPQLPPSGSGDVMNARHPSPLPGDSAPASRTVPITTASPTTKATLGSGIIDPLSQAVGAGRKAIANRGLGIWKALRSIPLE
jgi:hypothetical protein